MERFTKEVDGAEYDYDDFYLGSFQVPYEELTHSLINEIFQLKLLFIYFMFKIICIENFFLYELLVIRYFSK